MNITRLLLPTRRWLQIRLRTLFLLATILYIYLAWPHLARQYAFWRLCSYGDREFTDLWSKPEATWDLKPKSPDTERIENLVRRVLPRRYKNRLAELILGGRPWLIRHLRNARGRLLIVSVRPPTNIPGEGDVRIVLLDGLGRIIVDKTASTENRMLPRAVHYDSSTHPFPCVVVDCDYFWDGVKQRQFLAVRGEKVALVWFDLTKGESLADPHWPRDHRQLGPEYRFATHASWSSALMASDDIDILEALVYLPPQEAIEKRDPSDINRLSVLSRSANPWIRQGAAAALAEFNPPSESSP